MDRIGLIMIYSKDVSSSNKQVSMKSMQKRQEKYFCRMFPTHFYFLKIQYVSSLLNIKTHIYKNCSKMDYRLTVLLCCICNEIYDHFLRRIIDNKLGYINTFYSQPQVPKAMLHHFIILFTELIFLLSASFILLLYVQSVSFIFLNVFNLLVLYTVQRTLTFE